MLKQYLSELVQTEDKTSRTALCWTRWTQKQLSKYERFMSSLKAAHHNCVFSTSRDGYMGMCPRGTAPGDLICVFLGHPSPFVIRNTDIATAPGVYCYGLIGECYVHGIIDGEVMEDSKKKVQEFLLI